MAIYYPASIVNTANFVLLPLSTSLYCKAGSEFIIIYLLMGSPEYRKYVYENHRVNSSFRRPDPSVQRL